MTPIEIMFATQMAMRDVFDRSKTTRRKADSKLPEILIDNAPFIIQNGPVSRL